MPRLRPRKGPGSYWPACKRSIAVVLASHVCSPLDSIFAVMYITRPQHFGCAKFPGAASEKQVPRYYADRLRDRRSSEEPALNTVMSFRTASAVRDLLFASSANLPAPSPAPPP